MPTEWSFTQLNVRNTLQIQKIIGAQNLPSPVIMNEFQASIFLHLNKQNMVIETE